MYVISLKWQVVPYNLLISQESYKNILKKRRKNSGVYLYTGSISFKNSKPPEGFLCIAWRYNTPYAI